MRHDPMQHSFNFTSPPSHESEEIQKWVTQHNQSVSSAAHKAPSSPGTLLSALDTKETQSNAVYLLRCVLGQNLRKSLEKAPTIRDKFAQALRAEIKIKNTSQNPALIVRHVLLKNQFPS